MVVCDDAIISHEETRALHKWLSAPVICGHDHHTAKEVHSRILIAWRRDRRSRYKDTNNKEN